MSAARRASFFLAIPLLLLSSLSPRCASAQAPVIAREKSGATALAYSLLGTFFPTVVGFSLLTTGASHTTEIVLLAAGVYVGPALGHVYSDNTDRAVKGAAIRIGITLATYLALSATGLCLESCEGRNEVLPALAFLGGLGLTLGSMVLDIGAAPTAAARFNDNRQVSMKLVPVVCPSQRWAGIAVRLNF